ncbi:MAG: folate-binding protein YgfZ [Hyphomicrobiaceae bacterium]
MSDAKLALLDDRSVISVTGEDARKLLQDLVTNSIDGLARPTAGIAPQAVHAGLLSPQGKLLFEFFIAATPDGLLLDVAAAQAAALVQRLTLYRLRAKAEIKDESGAFAVVAVWDGDPPPSDPPAHFRDPRHASIGARWIVAKADVDAQARSAAAFKAYHAHRIGLGIPEGGKDYDFGDTFAHEANFDLNHGVSFTKGCFVGQEIVARMEHRGTARKRVARVTADSDLPADRPDVKAGEVTIGRMGSVDGCHGLALVRLDRVVEAADKGRPITAAGLDLRVDPEMLDRWRKISARRST